MLLTKNFLRRLTRDPLPSKQTMGGSNPYGAELLGNITATAGSASSAGGGGAAGAATAAVGETVILDKSVSPDAIKQCNDAISFLYNEIQNLKNQISTKQANGEDVSTDIARLSERCESFVEGLNEFSESINSNMKEVTDYIMDKNVYRVEEAFHIYESVYRDDKRIRFTPKQNLEFHRMAMERRNDVENLLMDQNEGIRICSMYCENARANGDFATMGVVLSTLKTMESARDSIAEVYSALSFSKVQEATPEQVGYLRENALTVKLKTFRDIFNTKLHDPTTAELMKNKEMNITYKKWLELQNQQDELIKEREKLYTMNHKKPNKTTTDAISRINGRLGQVMKQIANLDEKITNIETELMKQNCMSKSYWKRRIEQCQSAIESNKKRIAEKEKHLEFVEKMLGDEKVQANPDAVKGISLERDAIKSEIELINKSIDKSKMAIVKWKGIAKNAPDKTAVRDGKVTVESATMGERLDKLVDNFVNRQLRADDDFKELDDKLWKVKAELNSLNRKAVRAEEREDDPSDIIEKIKEMEKELKEIQEKWDKRLEEISNYLPYSYWKKLSDRYLKQIVWNEDMAESFEDSVKDARKELASIESGWSQGSAALMRANIKFYSERASFYKQETKKLMRLQKDAEERMKKAPNDRKKK